MSDHIILTGKSDVIEVNCPLGSDNYFLNLTAMKSKINPGMVYGIYVNLTEETFSTAHVGNLSFYGIDHHNIDLTYDVTEQVGNTHSSTSTVTFVPIGLAGMSEISTSVDIKVFINITNKAR